MMDKGLKGVICLEGLKILTLKALRVLNPLKIDGGG